MITGAATKPLIVDALGDASVEYTRADWADIEKHFGATQNSEKARDISRRLHERGRLLVYSRSNSLMFLYVGQDGRASHASCFLQ